MLFEQQQHRLRQRNDLIVRDNLFTLSKSGFMRRDSWMQLDDYLISRLYGWLVQLGYSEHLLFPNEC